MFGRAVITIENRTLVRRQKLIKLDSKISNADYEIYTDGSRIENETGFAVCILKDEINIQNYLFKLNTYTSVFQAELAAIEFAVNWAINEKVKVNIHTDSLSSISAINSANTRSESVNKVKSNIFKAKNMVGLSWVKAHVGIPENELADQQAKLAITSGEKFVIPAPYSHLKGLLKNYIVNKWNEYWNSYDSASGIRVRGYINQAPYTADLQWNRVSNLEPSGPKAETLPLGHRGLCQMLRAADLISDFRTESVLRAAIRLERKRIRTKTRVNTVTRYYGTMRRFAGETGTASLGNDETSATRSGYTT
ncbi:hypothetical protein AVEN_266527-1 [Araneus ventricosus]|uniref:RNase H type-1 domain-containing protein n=1 Tax=Araneus ventricosus TaxID=182803 RepID=A0A4Y2MUE7_ARAVE|nr:hypothetical protein AVEN_266527-1 [Araneus ventricosus]